MATTDSPTVLQRRLRAELRRARDNARLTQEQVAEELDWSLSKIIRIESGTVSIRITDLKALLQHYDVEEGKINDLIEISRSARERTWWSSYKRVISQAYLDRIGYEAAASVIRQAEPLVIPGLLQIEEYAESYLRGMSPPDQSENVSTLVEIRMRRQEIFESADPPQFFFILDEATILREIGGRQVMRNQLRHLVDMTRRPNVTIEVIPFGAGVHPGLGGAFTIIEFPDPDDDDVLHLESPRDLLISRDLRDDVVTYREQFERLRSLSLGPEGSAVRINSASEAMRD